MSNKAWAFYIDGGHLAAHGSRTVQCYTQRWHVNREAGGRRKGGQLLAQWDMFSLMEYFRISLESQVHVERLVGGVNRTVVSECLDNELVIRGLGRAGKGSPGCCITPPVGSRGSSAPWGSGGPCVRGRGVHQFSI